MKAAMRGLLLLIVVTIKCIAQFGSGSAGALTVNAPNTIINNVATRIISPSAITKTLNVTSSSGFAANDVVLIMQMTGSGAGNWEYRSIASLTATSITLQAFTSRSYNTSDIVQIIKVPQYTTLTINSGGEITCNPWNGTTGGIVTFIASSGLTIADGGKINVIGKGYSGVNGGNGSNGGNGGVGGTAGSTGGDGGSNGLLMNGIGGGGNGGKKGDNGIPGGTSTPPINPGSGLTASNQSVLGSKILMGSGGNGGNGGNGGSGAGSGGGGAHGSNPADNGENGGSGGNGGNGGTGGNGGGIILFAARTITLPSTGVQFYLDGTAGSSGGNGTNGGKGGNGGLGGGDCITGGGGGGGNGADGGNGGNGGNGGAGGSLYFNYQNQSINWSSSRISYGGGSGGSGGLGGNGGAAGLNAGTKNGATCTSGSGGRMIMPGSGSGIDLLCDFSTTISILQNMGASGNSSGTKAIMGNITIYYNADKMVFVEKLNTHQVAVVAYQTTPALTTYTIIEDPNGINSPEQTIDDLFTNSNSANFSVGPDLISSNGETFQGVCDITTREIPIPGLPGSSGTNGTGGGIGAVAAAPGGVALPLTLLACSIKAEENEKIFQWTFINYGSQTLKFLLMYSQNGSDFQKIDSISGNYSSGQLYTLSLPAPSTNGYLKLIYVDENDQLTEGPIINLSDSIPIKLYYNSDLETIHIQSTGIEITNILIIGTNGINMYLDEQVHETEQIINVHHYQKGMYILKIQTLDDLQILKFVK